MKKGGGVLLVTPTPRENRWGPRNHALETPNGGEPFVLLFDPITFGTPAGKKEIEV